MSCPTPEATESGGARSILDAATELFAEEGFEPVSVARIAARAGVCKANVFHHFESKEALLLAVIEQASGEHAERAEALLTDPARVAEKLRQLFAFELRSMIDNGARTQLMLRECHDRGHPLARELAQQVFKRNFDAVTALVDQGRTRGEFRADIEPAAVTVSMIAAKHFFLRQRLAMLDKPELHHLAEPEVYADQICTILLRGIVASPGTITPAGAPPKTRKRRS